VLATEGGKIFWQPAALGSVYDIVQANFDGTQLRGYRGLGAPASFVVTKRYIYWSAGGDLRRVARK
jgi:hypothetical protein